MAVLAVAGLAVAGAPSVAATPPRPNAPHTPGAPVGTGRFDLRQQLTAQARSALALGAAKVDASAAVRTLRRSLGRQAVIDIDPSTATPRMVGRLDGFLTGPSLAKPADIALRYVTAHADAFGLTSADLAGLRLSRDYRDIAGIHHLSWAQTIDGVPLFDNGLKANVAPDGRLISLQGSPVSHLRAPAVTTQLSASSAIVKAKENLGATQVAPARGDVAQRVLFATGGGTRPAYQVVSMSVASPALSVVDGVTGRVLYRQPLTSDAGSKSSNETASVFANFPGAASGGTQKTVDLTKAGYLPAGSVALFGNNVHTYTDVNDDNAPQSTEEVAPATNGSYIFKQQQVRDVAGEPCDRFVCTWRPDVPRSWELNRSQTATQNFFFINNFHDHLAAAPIGFTEAAGNFQQVNRTGKGLGGDPVQDEPLDGAATAGGLPDPNHIDNANFATPPDGQAPRMQMFLWHEPGTAYPNEDAFIAASGADEADIVYHEFTHGLSHRLVVDANNIPALDSVQGGSMGEAWSDWYALDYLVNQGLMKDTSAPAQVEVGRYVRPEHTFRSEPTDCPVSAPATACPGTPGAGPGGYTYGDFGKISSRGAEVHADGEIWAQTLWDLRAAIGAKVSESIVTRGMELSPTFPSYLDMRNAILQADLVVRGGRDVNAIWKVFAHRGMGFFAGSVTGGDVHPVEDFSLPPTADAPTSTVRGTVLDSESGQPVAGTVVAFGGHDSGFPGSLAATTDADGHFTIEHVFFGRYPDVFAGGAGFNPQTRTVEVHEQTTNLSFSLVRDWAASSGGATVAATNGDEFADFGCGAAALVDQALTNGWGTLVAPGGKFATIKLPRAVDISSLQIDPSGTCGDDLNASAGDYRIETSTDGTTFVVAASGTFTAADTGHLSEVALAAGTGDGVRFVRYTMLGNQAAARGVNCATAPAEGCPFLDSQEMEIFGTPSATQ